jgi:hypothetical protein
MPATLVAMRMLFLALLLSQLCWADPIDNLVTQLSATHGMWVNGLFPTLKLPPEASDEELLAGLARYIKNPRIVTVREVTIEQGAKPYRALLLKTEEGPRILLLQHQGSVGWWSRVYTPD